MSKKDKKNKPPIDESSSEEEEDEKGENVKMNMHDYQKYLSKLFPSKYLDKKIKEKEGESSKPELYNIIISFDAKEESDSDSDWESCSSSSSEEDSEEETESESDSESSSSSSSSSEEEEPIRKKKRTASKDKEKEKEKVIEGPILSDKDDSALFLQIKELAEQHKDNRFINNCISMYEEELREKEKEREKEMKKQAKLYEKEFHGLMTGNTGKKTNIHDIFKAEPIDSQKFLIDEMKEVNRISKFDKPYRLEILGSKTLPREYKAIALKKITSMQRMDPSTGEYHKIRNWVDTFLRIPFGKYEKLPICLDDGLEKCHEFMENSQKILDDAVYGLDDAKMQIMQFLGQMISNPNSVGSSIAIHGPMGTGKTSLIKEGVSKILKRPFAFIALGGATDSSFLEGCGYSYEGSMYGQIVQILINSRCMNPVIYFDELDKVSDTSKGQEIISILTHITDTSQNSLFHDKYFSQLTFDLSKCLFIFSYNDESRINPILKDRMYHIMTNGYSQKEKSVISTKYLFPRLCEQVNFKQEDVIIPPETMNHIIERYCGKEAGVRNLKRCLESILTKLNLFRLMRPGSNLFKDSLKLECNFPITVTSSIVDKLIKVEGNSALMNMYV